MTETRRAPGTGSVYFDRSKGRWVVTLDTGWSRTGSRRRPKRMTNPKTGKAIRDEAEARRVLRDWLREDVTETRTVKTVKAWADEWLPLRAAAVDPNSYRTDASAVRVWIVPTIGKKRLDQLTPGDIRAVIRAAKDAGRAYSSLVRLRATLVAMLKGARAEGYAISDRLLEVEIRKADDPVHREDVPVRDALLILAAARPEGLDDGSDSRWLAALLAGVRPAEARGLTWPYVDLDAGTLDVSWQLLALPYLVKGDRSSGYRVPDGYTAVPLSDLVPDGADVDPRVLRTGSYHLVRPKTGAGQRIVPMPQVLVESLTRWREFGPGSPYGLVWPRAHSDWYPWKDGWPRLDTADRDEWRALCERAGVGPYDLYSARHTTATQLQEAGVDDATITAIMGHASIRSSTPYLHPDRAAAMRDAISQVAGRLAIKR